MLATLARMEPPDEHIPNEDAQVNFMAAKHAKFKRKTAARRGAAPTLASSQLWETDDLSEKLIVLWAQLQPLLEEPPANPADDGLPGEVPNPQSKLLSARVERWNSLAAQNHAAQMRDGWIGSLPLASGPGGGMNVLVGRTPSVSRQQAMKLSLQRLEWNPSEPAAM